MVVWFVVVLLWFLFGFLVGFVVGLLTLLCGCRTMIFSYRRIIVRVADLIKTKSRRFSLIKCMSF